MHDRLSVGIRYCGGCNPRYDRVAAVKAMERECPNVSFVSADGTQTLTALICGCSAQCVFRDDIQGLCLSLYRADDFETILAYIRTLEKERILHGLEKPL